MATQTAALKPRIRPAHGSFVSVRQLVSGLATVCEESKCPNVSECWSTGTATFMVMGDTCTRGCRFCNVKTALKPAPLDPTEPSRLAQAVKSMGLDYVVITSVDRDDLEDMGAAHFAECISAVKALGVMVEVLIPDFQGRQSLLKQVVDSGPLVLAHNIETVERLQSNVRDHRAGYRQSLGVLGNAKALGAKFTKSSIMLGLGETGEEVLQALHDLRSVGVDIVTFGQYLQPTQKHLKVKGWVPKERFGFYKQMAEELGFMFVASGPLVRSSYRASEAFVKKVFA